MTEVSQASYIIRLDDASPTMHLKKWERIEDLLDKYNVPALVAVIPNCRDQKQKYSPYNGNFWNKVNQWQDKGWEIGLHGYDHVYITKEAGLVPINKQSEFAGVSFEKQKEKIRDGIKIFAENNIFPKIWVAPSHSFDINTLKALKYETNIRVISDGVAYKPYKKYGFNWIPQQLWQFQNKNKGIWTSCFHPNTMEEKDFYELEKFLENNRQYVISINQIQNFKARSLNDYLLSLTFFGRRYVYQKFFCLLKV